MDPRGIEIRGRAELHAEGGEQRFGGGGWDSAWFTIVPQRIISWGIEGPAFSETGRSARTITLNKKDWRHPSSERREVWRPTAGSQGTGPDLFIKQGVDATITFHALDGYESYPLALVGPFDEMFPRAAWLMGGTEDGQLMVKRVRPKGRLEAGRTFSVDETPPWRSAYATRTPPLQRPFFELCRRPIDTPAAREAESGAQDAALAGEAGPGTVC